MRRSNWCTTLSISMLLFLSACATPYQQQGQAGGYTERRIDDQTYRVEFAGNGYTSQEQVHNYFMYRCAELTQRAGFKYFTIIPASYSGATDPVDRLTRGDLFDHRLMHKVRTAAPIIIYGGDGDGLPHWTRNGYIRMFNDDAVIPTSIVGWSAAELLAQLGPYVRGGAKTQVVLPMPWVFDAHGKRRAESLLPSSPKADTDPVPASPSKV